MKGITPLEYSNKMLRVIKPKYSYELGANIEKFQQNGRRDLKTLLGIDKITPKTDKNNINIEFDRRTEDLGCREIRFVLESEPEIFVPCHLFIPENSRKAPLVFALHGHSTGMHTAMGRPKYDIDKMAIEAQECDIIKQAISHGFSALSIEHRGFGERGGSDIGTNCTELAMRALLYGRTLAGDRVFDAICALNATTTNFSNLVDTDNLICIGYSGGGTIATYLSAIDERINSTVIVSAISTFHSSIGAMHHCACNYVPSMAKYFDVGNLCQLIAPRRLIIVSGEDDPIFPYEGAKESVKIAKQAFLAYGKENNITHIKAKGAHKFYPEEVWNNI